MTACSSSWSGWPPTSTSRPRRWRSIPQRRRDSLGELRRDVQEALEETRTLADRIYPPLLEAGGLSVALRCRGGGRRRPHPDRHLDRRERVRWRSPASSISAASTCSSAQTQGRPWRSPCGTTEGTLAFEVVADCDVGADLPSRDRVEALGGRLTIRREPDHQTQRGRLPAAVRDEASRSPPDRGSRPSRACGRRPPT